MSLLVEQYGNVPAKPYYALSDSLEDYLDVLQRNPKHNTVQVQYFDFADLKDIEEERAWLQDLPTVAEGVANIVTAVKIKFGARMEVMVSAIIEGISEWNTTYCRNWWLDAKDKLLGHYRTVQCPTFNTFLDGEVGKLWRAYGDGKITLEQWSYLAVALSATASRISLDKIQRQIELLHSWRIATEDFDSLMENGLGTPLIGFIANASALIKGPQRKPFLDNLWQQIQGAFCKAPDVTFPEEIASKLPNLISHIDFIKSAMDEAKAAIIDLTSDDDEFVGHEPDYGLGSPPSAPPRPDARPRGRGRTGGRGGRGGGGQQGRRPGLRSGTAAATDGGGDGGAGGAGAGGSDDDDGDEDGDRPPNPNPLPGHAADGNQDILAAFARYLRETADRNIRQHNTPHHLGNPRLPILGDDAQESVTAISVYQHIMQLRIWFQGEPDATAIATANKCFGNYAAVMWDAYCQQNPAPTVWQEWTEAVINCFGGNHAKQEAFGFFTDPQKRTFQNEKDAHPFLMTGSHQYSMMGAEFKAQLTESAACLMMYHRLNHQTKKLLQFEITPGLMTEGGLKDFPTFLRHAERVDNLRRDREASRRKRSGDTLAGSPAKRQQYSHNTNNYNGQGASSSRGRGFFGRGGNRGGSRGGSRGGGRSSFRPQSQQQPGSGAFPPPPTGKCWNCGQSGHRAFNCPNNNKHKKPNGSKNK
jgi:uncharacterized membrane protein YgcG